MKWIKLGKVFDPTQFKLAANCFEYAQSPQALVFDNFVRIYFSTRAKDTTGKYLSHISFVDVDKTFKKIINISKDQVIELGGLGCFDEHGIFPLNVFRDKERIIGYIGGWNRKVSVSIDGAIGMAISNNNGVTFQRIGAGPILAATLREPFLIGDPFVQFYEGMYHMWYIFGTNWKVFSKGDSPDRTYKIGHAISKNGIDWDKEEARQIIKDKFDSNESQALPTVIKILNRYHMFFCYRQSSDFRKSIGRGYRIGYAYSDDLIHWIRDDNNSGIDVSEEGWDSEMLCYPHVFQLDNKVYMLYNGNEFGRFGFGIAELDGFA